MPQRRLSSVMSRALNFVGTVVSWWIPYGTCHSATKATKHLLKAIRKHASFPVACFAPRPGLYKPGFGWWGLVRNAGSSRIGGEIEMIARAPQACIHPTSWLPVIIKRSVALSFFHYSIIGWCAFPKTMDLVTLSDNAFTMSNRGRVKYSLQYEYEYNLE